MAQRRGSMKADMPPRRERAICQSMLLSWTAEWSWCWRSMKRRFLWLGALLTGLVIWAVGLGCWPFVQWSRLNCSHEDIDINSGRVRTRHFLLGFCVSESVEESDFSRVASSDTVDSSPAWHRVNTFSPMVHYSPHYRYHAAIWQAREIEQLRHFAEFTPEAKRRMARDVLSIWQWEEGYYPVNDYLTRVESLIPDRGEKTISEQDLPTIESIKKRRQEPVR